MKMKTPIPATMSPNATPPMTPPAIAPTFVSLAWCVGLGVWGGENEVTGFAVLDVLDNDELAVLVSRVMAFEVVASFVHWSKL